MLKGIAASQGIAIEKVYKYQRPVLNITKTTATPDAEVQRLEKALEKTIADITAIKEHASKTLKEEELAIFDAHLMMASDPELKDQIVGQIQSEQVNAEYATQQVSKTMVEMFESLEDAYMKERAADVKDVTFRLCCNLVGVEIPSLSTLNEPVIIVAKDLTPSDTASLNKEFAKGFVTEIGGRTSHSAIMARSLEIPAIVGCKGILEEAKNGEEMILDAMEGNVILKPSAQEVADYQKKAEAFEEDKKSLLALVHEPSTSKDGHTVELVGNIGSPNDVQGVLENGGEGVGLFRTEFLYMNSETDFPDEESQFQAYKAVLEGMKGKKVVIRTLDIGGDKKLKYYQFDEEMNPFLGVRAVRFCLLKPEIFRVQLRALLRASAFGQLAIMFPMIATLDEFRKAKALLEEEKAKLAKEGVKMGDKIEVGIMVEIPASAVLADQFAKEADFFSIGTNDLIQYSMAADRMSEKVSYLYQPLNPSILRLVKSAIDGAHAHGKWCGMCGEMAGDELAAPVLMGLGLDEFSMSATSILRARRMLKGLNYEEMKTMADAALQCETRDDVVALVKKSISK